MTPSIKVAPSILSSDFARLAEEAKFMKQCGAHWLHVDCMDGHFVPNLTIGPPIVKSLSKHTDMYLDCHLMVTNPSQWIEDFSKAGASGITFHIETFSTSIYDKDGQGSFECNLTKAQRDNVINLCNRIDALGMHVGIALRPRTPVDCIQFLFEQHNKKLINLLLIMTVEPGFGGQKFMSFLRPKIEYARQIYPDLNIQVDGGISPETVHTVVQAGANVLVAGSAIFGSDDPNAIIQCLSRGGKTN